MTEVYKLPVVIVFVLICQLALAQQQVHVEKIKTKSDSIESNLTATPDSLSIEVTALKQKLKNRIDSLKAKKNSTTTFQKKLDSLNNITNAPNEKYKKLSSPPHEVQLDTLDRVQTKVKNSLAEVNGISTDVGIGNLGEGVQTSVGLSGVSLPVAAPNTIDMSIPSIDQPALNAQTPEVPGEVGQINKNIPDVSGGIKTGGSITNEVNEYSKDIQTIHEEGLSKSEKLPELAEQQASQLEEIKTLQEGQAMTTEQIEEYKKQIEQYKDEKKIEEELKEKLKEVANDVIIQNQGQVDKSMKKISKYKRKFSSVHDLRNLPNHAPNPLKNLSWRERVIPGIAFQTLSSSELWLAFDPHIYYRITSNWSAGVGGIYRFTMNQDKLTFADFNSMYGYKIMTRYSAFKGIFIQAEGHRVTWKPWETRLKDPDYRQTIFVAVAGIGKSHAIAKRLKGNVQALYHYAWGGDPYKPKIMLKFGLDFSIAKKENQPWEQRLKDLKHCD